MRRLAPLVLALLACSGTESVPGPPAPVTLARSEAWAGSTLRIRSADFDLPGADTARVLIDTFALAVTRVDDTTLAVALPPALRGGDHPMRLVRGADTTGLTPLRVYGYMDTRTFALTASAFGQYAPHLAPLRVNGAGGGRLRTYDLVTGVVEDHGPLPNQSGLCRTAEEGVVLLRRTQNGPLARWRLFPVPVEVAGETMEAGAGPIRGCVWTRPNARLFTSGDAVLLQVRSGPGAAWLPADEPFLNFDGTDGAIVSPSGDLAMVLSHLGPGNALPVYETTTLARRFTLPLRASLVAAFSEDGQHLLAAGHASTNQGELYRRLVLVRTTDGSLVRDTLMSAMVGGIRFDPVRPLVYVALIVQGGMEVLVLDAATLRVLGRIAMGPGGSVGGSLLAPSTTHLHAFTGSAVHRVTLPAGTGGVFPP